eukprot:GFKZ01004264.1.p1 GENE.GFKZ01004264.1~~GFKZ01004264.1.p1  ORF type:complete len:219 (+),score=12.97 GFKZ01004264.1:325-981(+)
MTTIAEWKGHLLADRISHRNGLGTPVKIHLVSIKLQGEGSSYTWRGQFNQMLQPACGGTDPRKVEMYASIANLFDHGERSVAIRDLLLNESRHKLGGPYQGAEEVNALLGEILSGEALQYRRCPVDRLGRPEYPGFGRVKKKPVLGSTVRKDVDCLLELSVLAEESAVIGVPPMELQRGGMGNFFCQGLHNEGKHERTGGFSLLHPVLTGNVVCKPRG